MRHFIWYKTSGELGGVESRTGGWDDHVDITDPNTSDSVAQLIRSHRPTSVDDFGGFAIYECDCPIQDSHCACPHELVSTHYYESNEFAPKPDRDIELNGAAANLYLPNDFTPGTTVSLTLRSSVPDGHTLSIENISSLGGIIDGAQSISFTSGISSELNIDVPPQGVMGAITGSSNLIRDFRIIIRGWA